MNIKEAILIIGEKMPIVKEQSLKAQTDEDSLLEFVDYICEQYYHNNKELAGSLCVRYGRDVIDCIIQYAKTLNAIADVRVINRQFLEETINLN